MTNRPLQTAFYHCESAGGEDLLDGATLHVPRSRDIESRTPTVSVFSHGNIEVIGTAVNSKTIGRD